MKGCLVGLLVGVGGWVVVILAVREVGPVATVLLLAVGSVLGVLRLRWGGRR